MYARQFIVVDSVQLDNPTYRRFTGFTFCEHNLRIWAKDQWKTPLNATLNMIARDIKRGGWEMFEYVIPAGAHSEPDAVSEFLDKIDES